MQSRQSWKSGKFQANDDIVGAKVYQYENDIEIGGVIDANK